MWRLSLVLLAVSVSLWAQDPDRPVLKRKPAEPTPETQKQDPDRPVLKRKTPPAESEPDKKKDEAKKDEARPGAESEDYNRTMKPVPVQPDAADPGAPKLRRGAPAADRQPPATSATDPVPPESRTGKPVLEIETDIDGRVLRRNSNLPGANDAFIEEAADTAFEFSQNLPNFICNQLTWRSTSETRQPNWQVRDRIESEVIIVDGRENYRNTRLSGKPIKDPKQIEKGTWSLGEFGSWLTSIYSPASKAKFRLRGNSTAAGLPAKVYDFEVERPHSPWRVVLNRVVYPAFTGSVWIDPQTKRTLRIEAQARNLDSDLTHDHMEVAIDYGWVTIGGRKYLLPVHSDNISCERGSYNCSRNEIEFKNYRKFDAESSLSQVESDIAYPQSESKVSYPSASPTPKKKE